jgi:hypothetical protein
MPRLIAVLTLSLTLAAPLLARADAPATTPTKRVAMRYRTLTKMLHRFSRQATATAATRTPAHERVLAAR